MKNLLLMRHGDAPYGSIDSERQLSELGAWQCEQVAEKFNKRSINSVLTSDYQRAIDSARLFMGKGSDYSFSQTEGLRPSADMLQGAKQILEHLEHLPPDGTLLVVCHMSIIAQLAQLFLEGHGQYSNTFSTAELWFLRSELLSLGGFELVHKVLAPQK